MLGKAGERTVWFKIVTKPPEMIIAIIKISEEDIQL